MIEESLLKRGPASPGAGGRGLADLLDPAAFEERLREARARRAIALATRAATGGGGLPNPARATPPIFPARAGVFETEAPVFAPSRARGGEPAAERAAPRRRSDAAAAPRIEVTPGRSSRVGPPAFLATLGAQAALIAAPSRPFLAALAGRAAALASGVALPASLGAPWRRSLRFTRRHAAPLVASCVIAGIAFGAAGVWLSPGGAPAQAPTEARRAEAPPAQPAPALLAKAETPAPAPTPAAATPAAKPAPEPKPEPAAPVVELLPDPEPDQMPSPEPDLAPIPAALPAAAPPALVGEYLTSRPRPRPAGIALAAPAAEAAAAYPGTRVVVNVPAGKTAENVEETLALISAAGFPKVERARVGVDMSTDQVRYFHAADAEAARALAGLTGAITRDFTSHTPPPRKGYLELWLAGTAPRHVAAAPAEEDQILGILRDRAAKN